MSEGSRRDTGFSSVRRADWGNEPVDVYYKNADLEPADLSGVSEHEDEVKILGWAHDIKLTLEELGRFRSVPHARDVIWSPEDWQNKLKRSKELSQALKALFSEKGYVMPAKLAEKISTIEALEEEGLIKQYLKGRLENITKIIEDLDMEGLDNFEGASWYISGELRQLETFAVNYTSQGSEIASIIREYETPKKEDMPSLATISESSLGEAQLNFWINRCRVMVETIRKVYGI